MSSRLTLEELRKVEVIATEQADSYYEEHHNSYRAHLTRVLQSAIDGHPAAPRDYIKLDRLYNRYTHLGATILPAFTIALNQLEEAQRLLKIAKVALVEAEWGGREAPPGLSQFDDRTTCPVCSVPSGGDHHEGCSLGIALKEMYPERKQDPELWVDTEARDG